MPSVSDRILSREEQQNIFLSNLDLLRKGLMRFSPAQVELPTPSTKVMSLLEPLVLKYHWLLRNHDLALSYLEDRRLMYDGKQEAGNGEVLRSLIQAMCDQVLILNKGDGEEKAGALCRHAEQVIACITSIQKQVNRPKSIPTAAIKNAVSALRQLLTYQFCISETEYHLRVCVATKVRISRVKVRQLEATGLTVSMGSGELDHSIRGAFQTLCDEHSDKLRFEGLARQVREYFAMQDASKEAVNEIMVILPVLRQSTEVTQDLFMGSLMLRYLIDAIEQGWTLERASDQFPVFKCVMNTVTTPAYQIYLFDSVRYFLLSETLTTVNCQQVIPLFESLSQAWELQGHHIPGLLACMLDEAVDSTEKRLVAANTFFEKNQIQKRQLKVRLSEQAVSGMFRAWGGNSALGRKAINTLQGAEPFLMMCAKHTPLASGIFFKKVFDHVFMHLKQGWGEYYTRKYLSSIVQSVEVASSG